MIFYRNFFRKYLSTLLSYTKITENLSHNNMPRNVKLCKLSKYTDFVHARIINHSVLCYLNCILFYR